MKRKITLLAAAIASAMILSGCLGDSNRPSGSFACVKKVHDVNCTITDNKWINEILFIIPGCFCYPIGGFLDVIIFNSIQFWTGDNPLVSTTFTDPNGVEYLVAKTDSTLSITNQSTGEVANFSYNADSRTWLCIDADGEAKKIATLIEDGKALVYTDNGAEEIAF